MSRQETRKNRGPWTMARVMRHVKVAGNLPERGVSALLAEIDRLTGEVERRDSVIRCIELRAKAILRGDSPVAAAREISSFCRMNGEGGIEGSLLRGDPDWPGMPLAPADDDGTP